MNSEFTGKTVIITGASAGVGAACARAFAAQKANLVLSARGQEGLDRIADELSPQCSVLTVAMDVANSEQCMELLAKAEAKFGHVDVLVNNAGMHNRGDLEKLDPADVGAMVDINMRAPLILSCAAIPYLRRAGSGSIVMVDLWLVCLHFKAPQLILGLKQACVPLRTRLLMKFGNQELRLV